MRSDRIIAFDRCRFPAFPAIYRTLNSECPRDIDKLVVTCRGADIRGNPSLTPQPLIFRIIYALSDGRERGRRRFAHRFNFTKFFSHIGINCLHYGWNTWRAFLSTKLASGITSIVARNLTRSLSRELGALRSTCGIVTNSINTV